MPYLFETKKMKIREEDKLSVKLSPTQKLEIKKKYETGHYSQRELARMYNVSRGTVVYCIYPEKYEISRQQFKERQKTGRYYDKEKQRQYISSLRKRKKELYRQERLIGGQNERRVMEQD